jgi:hypothetical protein
MKGKRDLVVLLALAAMCVSLVSCGEDSVTDSDDNVDNTDFVASEPFHFRVDVVGQRRLYLEGVSGSISITGVAGSDSIVISGERRVRSESTEDAAEHLELLEVSVQEVLSDVVVKTIQPQKSYGRSYEVDYNITLPETLDVGIANVNGQIMIDDIFGSAFVDLVNGQVGSEVTLLSGSTIDMDVVNGGIALAIPQSTSAQFSATVVNGVITDSDLDFQDRESAPTYLRGRLGSGDGTTSLNVVNGTIDVSGF